MNKIGEWFSQELKSWNLNTPGIETGNKLEDLNLQFQGISENTVGEMTNELHPISHAPALITQSLKLSKLRGLSTANNGKFRMRVGTTNNTDRLCTSRDSNNKNNRFNSTFGGQSWISKLPLVVDAERLPISNSPSFRQ